MMGQITGALYGMRGRQDLALIGILLTSIIVMIIPMPTLMIDVLIAFNISLTVLILIVAVYIDRPTSFSTFPAIILIATTFRLAISISTTRTVLTTAEGGAIIETFGNFVTGGNIIVGLVIFLIITIVQFIVITKGAERVAEVAARFVLDALPGRQLSIDAELRAGDITPDEARRRRRLLDKENQFFGAMDGAMKFVKGDAIAGLLIIAVNLIGGIAIGTTQLGMSIGQAASSFSLLTIGDGLVAQIPALLLALCSGAVVTRVTSEESSDLGKDIAAELAGSTRALYVAAGVVTALGFIPGFPTVMFLIFGALLGWTGYQISEAIRLREEAAKADIPAPSEAEIHAAAAGEPVDAKSGDRIVIRVGEALGARIDGAGFAQARSEERSRYEQRYGFPAPRFGLLTDAGLAPDGFAVDLDRVPLFAGQIPADAVAMAGDSRIADMLRLPHMDVPANWRLQRVIFIREADAEQARQAGQKVVMPGHLLALLAGRLLTDHAGQIVGHEDVQKILETLRRDAPQFAEQVTKQLNQNLMADVIRRLVDDGTPLVPARAVFEAMLEWAPRETDSAILAEHVRRGLRRQLCHRYADQNRMIATHVIEPDLEAALREALRSTDAGTFLTLPSKLASSFLALVEKVTQSADPAAPDPVILTSVDLRRHVQTYLKSHNLPLPVFSYQEIAPEFVAQPVGTLTLGADGSVQPRAA